MAAAHRKNEAHILYVVTKLELGGAQKVCLSLFEGLGKHGYQTSLLSGAEGELVSRARKSASVYLLKDFKREIGFRLLIKEVRAFFSMWRTMRALRKRHPHLIVHTHAPKAGFVGRWAAFFAGVKTRIHTVHGFGFHRAQFFLSWFAHYFLEFFTSLITTHYICVSKKLMQTGGRLFPRFSKKSTLIRAAVDSSAFFTPAIAPTSDKKSFTFGAIACFKPPKDLLTLFKAFKHFRDGLSAENQRRVVLEVIGDGSLRPVLEQWIEKNRLQESIHLLGWRHDVAPYLAAWDVFVMSSQWEALPCAIVEARLSRKPVVATNVGGIPEVIIDGKNGFLVPPGDSQALATRMHHLFVDVSLRERMFLYEDQLGEFYNESMIEAHALLYEKLL